MQPHEPASLPFISVVMPVRDEGRYIAATLRQLLGQDYPAERFEILVVDGCSDDNTVDEVRQVAATAVVPVRVLPNPGRLSSRARNIGVREARGEWILIIDGHVHIKDRELLINSARILARTGARVLGRAQRLRAPGVGEFGAAVARFRESRLGHSANSWIFTPHEGWVDPGSVAVMYQRSLFQEHGGFDESLDAAEDYAFNSRLARSGLRCYISPLLEVFYYPRETPGALLRQMRRYGLGQARLARRAGAGGALGGWIPAVFVVAAPLMALVSAFDRRVALFTLCMGALYWVVVYAATADFCGLNSRRTVRMLVVALAVHAGLGIGWWSGMLERRARAAGATST
jgi:succinoglycan biosynthesis protein ExoA